MKDMIPAVLLAVGAAAVAADSADIKNDRRWPPMVGCLIALLTSAALWLMIFWAIFKLFRLV